MASTLQNIMAAITTLPWPTPMERVRYGIEDVQSVKDGPFIRLSDFVSNKEYDTSGPRVKKSTFFVHVLATRLEDAETIAYAVDDLFDNVKVTPATMDTRQIGYTVQPQNVDESFYHVSIAYEIAEDLALA